MCLLRVFFSFLSRLPAFAACALLFPLLSGCPLEELCSKPGDDLSRAEEALGERDIAEARMYFERYLRKHPDGEDRWEVWLQLLSISLDIHQDKETAGEYLEIMLREFSGDSAKRRHIQMVLAGLYKDRRMYSRALPLWEILAADPGLSSEERAVVYRELSHAYLRRLEFTSATDMLGLCLHLDVGQDTKADCLYALAETQMLTDKLDESERALRDLLRLSGISTERRVLATFTLADVLEQRDKLAEAAELFESIRESYPNTKVVEVRLGALKHKMGGKKNSRKK